MDKVLELKPDDLKTIQEIVRFAANLASDLSPEARQALVISFFREFRKEVDEVRHVFGLDKSGGST